MAAGAAKGGGASAGRALLGRSAAEDATMGTSPPSLSLGLPGPLPGLLLPGLPLSAQGSSAPSSEASSSEEVEPFTARRAIRLGRSLLSSPLLLSLVTLRGLRLRMLLWLPLPAAKAGEEEARKDDVQGDGARVMSCVVCRVHTGRLCAARKPGPTENKTLAGHGH